MAINSIFLLVTFFYHLTFSTVIASDKLSIIEGQGFIIHLKVPENFGEIKYCWYKVQNDGNTLIDLHSTVPHQRETGEIITPYTKFICGIRVFNVSVAVSGNWMLEAENNDGRKFNDFTILTVSKALQLEPYRKIIKSPGKTTISCSDFPLRRSCRISNQLNGILSDQCEMPVTIRNKTSYKCSFHSWGSMHETSETIIINVDKSRGKTTEGNLNENESYFLMNCQFPKKIGNCRAEYPDKITQIYIRDGFNGERISAFDTDIENGKCVLEIKKPLKDDEIGIWKIISDDAKIQAGCLFYVHKNGTDKKELIRSELDKYPNQQTIEIVNVSSMNLKFTCKAPFILDYCYLRDPKNRIQIPSIYDFQQSRMLGHCTFENSEKISGEWICGMGGKDYDEEVIQKFNVIVVENGGKVINKNIRRLTGQSTDMLCQLNEQEPMTECAFIDPKGNVYLVSKEFDNKNKSRIQYFGNGLEFGDCGLTIKNLKEDEFGVWTCIMKTPPLNQYSYKINIEEPQIDQAIANGIGIGSTAVAAVLLMSVLFYYRRKHTQQIEQQTSRELQVEEQTPREIDNENEDTRL